MAVGFVNAALFAPFGNVDAALAFDFDGSAAAVDFGLADIDTAVCNDADVARRDDAAAGFRCLADVAVVFIARLPLFAVGFELDGA